MLEQGGHLGFWQGGQQKDRGIQEPAILSLPPDFRRLDAVARDEETNLRVDPPELVGNVDQVAHPMNVAQGAGVYHKWRVAHPIKHFLKGLAGWAGALKKRQVATIRNDVNARPV